MKLPHSVVGRCLNPGWQKSYPWTRGPFNSHLTPNSGPNSKSRSLLSTEILQATVADPGAGVPASLCSEREYAHSLPNKITQGTAGRQRPCLGTGPRHTRGTRGHPAEGTAKLFCSAVPPGAPGRQQGTGAPTPPCRVFHRETGAGLSGRPPAPPCWEPTRCEALPGRCCPPAAACCLPAGRRRSGGAPPGACRTAWLFRRVLPMARA